MFFDNPVLHRELFMRFRLRQMPLPVKIGIVIGILLSLGMVYWQIFVTLASSSDPMYGKSAWILCIVIQYVILCLVAPVITANTITQEKEQQTWEMLVSSRLDPLEIIFGKLIARLMLPMIIILLFAPISIFCWAHSAINTVETSLKSTIPDLILTYAVLILTTALFSTVGMFMSWHAKRTLFAVMLSYTFNIMGLLVITAIVTTMLATRFTDGSFFMHCPLMWVNPGFLMFEALNTSDGTNGRIFVVYGLICYVMMILLMLWRMALGFRRFSHD